jgi:hypothetical protein
MTRTSVVEVGLKFINALSEKESKNLKLKAELEASQEHILSLENGMFSSILCYPTNHSKLSVVHYLK